MSTILRVLSCLVSWVATAKLRRTAVTAERRATHPALAPNSALAVVDNAVDEPANRRFHLAQQSCVRLGRSRDGVKDVKRRDAARASRLEAGVCPRQNVNNVVAVLRSQRLGHIPQFANFGSRQARCAHRPVKEVIEGLIRQLASKTIAAETVTRQDSASGALCVCVHTFKSTMTRGVRRMLLWTSLVDLGPDDLEGG